jgi:hypothetical protein
MLTTAYDEFKPDLLRHGMGTLNVVDGRRNTDHKKIIRNFVNFLSLGKKNPVFNYVNDV